MMTSMTWYGGHDTTRHQTNTEIMDDKFLRSEIRKRRTFIIDKNVEPNLFFGLCVPFLYGLKHDTTSYIFPFTNFPGLLLVAIDTSLTQGSLTPL